MFRFMYRLRRLKYLVITGLIVGASYGCTSTPANDQTTGTTTEAYISEEAAGSTEVETYTTEYDIEPSTTTAATEEYLPEPASVSLDDVIPEYSGSLTCEINDGIPYLSKGTEDFEYYSSLDDLGRCGYAYANVSPSTMPTEERGEIGQIKPSGWHTVKYDCIEDRYLYNRCHLIAFCLAGENANERNLITGTRQMNVDGMLPYEEMVAKYIDRTGNHVLYRVTPYFKDDELVARGVLMEALSVEDDEICFNVFVYNVQDGISIDYATGESELIPTEETVADTEESIGETYILNTNTKKYHIPTCDSVSEIKEKNKKEFTGTKEELEQQGYTGCKRCID